MQNGWQFGPRRVFRAGAKRFRLGAVPGGNNNYRARADGHTVKADLPPDVAQRGEGAHMGGHRVMARYGVSWEGKGTAHMLGQKETLHTEGHG